MHNLSEEVQSLLWRPGPLSGNCLTEQGKCGFRSIRGVGPLCANYDALSMFTMCSESAKRLKPTQLIRLTSGELDDNSNG